VYTAQAQEVRKPSRLFVERSIREFPFCTDKREGIWYTTAALLERRGEAVIPHWLEMDLVKLIQDAPPLIR
jgi:hypothetical protein